MIKQNQETLRSLLRPIQQIIDFVFAEGAIAIASPDGRES